MLKWNEKFETGSALLDAQHRMLISYINQLETFTRTTNPTPGELELFMRVIDFLETYALTHFKEEEECMMRFKCPAHQENMEAHGAFLEFFRGFTKRLAAEGCRPELLRELHQYCAAWIQQHILGIDVQLKPSMNQASAAGGQN